MGLFYDPAVPIIPFIGIYTKEMKRDTCVLMFIEASFTVAKVSQVQKAKSHIFSLI
jgi:hypothetical protein